MKTALDIAQLVISVIFSGLVLLQAKGIGLGKSVSAGNYHTKRGVEKIVFRLTFVVAALFVGISLSHQFIH